MSLGLSWILTGHLLIMTVAMGTGAMPIWKENWEQCSLLQKLHRGGEKENVCFLCWHLAACFTRHPHTSIKQYLFQMKKSKFASPIIPAGTGRGCVKWISSRAALGHCLADSICNFITQQHWALSVFSPPSLSWRLLRALEGHRGGTGRVQLGKSNHLTQNQQIIVGWHWWKQEWCLCDHNFYR